MYVNRESTNHLILVKVLCFGEIVLKLVELSMQLLLLTLLICAPRT